MRLLLTALVLGLAWFAAANIAASAVSWLGSRLVLRSARALPIHVYLVLRLLPSTVSALLVAVVFVPAHVRFEPAVSDESFGLIPFALAALGLALLVRSGLKLFLVSVRARQIERWAMAPLESGSGDAFEARGFPGVSLAGVLRTRILVGSGVRAVLTAEELDLAVSHERAHRLAFDNLKRAAMFCAPDLFGWTPTASKLEAAWRDRAEAAADIRAAAGDATRAMHLASALLKVARLVGRSAAVPPRVWSTFHEPPLLEARVRRLVAGVPARPPEAGVSRHVVIAIAASAAGLWIADGFYGIHRATEALIVLLP